MVKLFPVGTRDRFIELVCGGASLQGAAAAVGASRMSGVRWWRQSGRMELGLEVGRHGGLVAGVPVADPSVSAVRRRPLSAGDRHAIQLGVRLGHSQGEIARAIGRDRSVVSREIARNSCEDGLYRGGVAQRMAAARRERPKPLKLITQPGLCTKIEEWLNDGWSPGLIAAVLARDHGSDQTRRVSHETIYRALYVQTRGQLRADLHRCLSTQR